MIRAFEPIEPEDFTQQLTYPLSPVRRQALARKAFLESQIAGINIVMQARSRVCRIVRQVTQSTIGHSGSFKRRCMVVRSTSKGDAIALARFITPTHNRPYSIVVMPAQAVHA